MSIATADERKALLEITRAVLKVEFFGIDPQVDSIIDSIKTWYLLPEIVSRPVITTLWGMTGTGKTALIRSLVKHLGFTSQFVEVQMDGFSQNASDDKSICSILCKSSIPEGGQGIILLDEFQRFRTVDNHGEDVRVERYADVWMLLSDGKFPSDYEALVKMENRMMFWDYYDDMWAADAAEKEADEEEPVSPVEVMVPKSPRPFKYRRKYYTTLDEAKSLKEILRYRESIYEIMTWSKEKVRTVLRKAIEDKYIPPIDYSKCLIFVSGNLDEAFTVAGDVEDCDTNADIFHEYTKKIGPPEIKVALLRRFKPEQIARLGNNSVIYPSLSKDAYMRIIRRACGEYISQASAAYKVAFTVEESVYQEVYDNAVYPTQGTRPVFTSIHKLFGSPLSDAIFWAREKSFNEIAISLDVPNSSLVFTNGEEKCSTRIDFEIRRRRAAYSDDYNALVAVHEAGHAILYAELFKMPPVEIAISVASFSGGYNRFKTEHLSKDEVLNRIAVGMGGVVAEEAIFGQELRSTGCASDIANATGLAAKYVRAYAMDGFASRIVYRGSMGGDGLNNDIDGSDPSIERIVKEQRDHAQTILTKHRNLLIDLSKRLIEVKKLSAEEFVTFVGSRIEGMERLNTRDVNGNYAARLNGISSESGQA